MDNLYKKINKCRICGSKDLMKYLDLGKTPLANSLLRKDETEAEKLFPLEVLYCKECSLSQLSVVVDPKMLFSNYVYHSSVSKTFREHCSEMAERMLQFFENPGNELVVDIASNDGCLLKEFKSRNFKVVGVEPAKNIAEIANSSGIETLQSFWNEDSAKKISREHGKASIITATNVFAHVDDLNDFLKNVRSLLDEDGFFIVEVPYMLDLLSRNEFDTVYHEHLSYFLVKPLKILFERNKMKIISIEKHDIHGGSLRIYSKKIGMEEESVQIFLDHERREGLHDTKSYADFQARVNSLREDLLSLLNELKNKGEKIAAYGASAKGNTLLNFCKIDTKILEFIVDDTPKKQGMLAPGSRIPIKDASFLESEKPGYVILLAWNFSSEIMKKTEDCRSWGMKYIVPIPKVEII